MVLVIYSALTHLLLTDLGSCVKFLLLLTVSYGNVAFNSNHNPIEFRKSVQIRLHVKKIRWQRKM